MVIVHNGISFNNEFQFCVLYVTVTQPRSQGFAAFPISKRQEALRTRLTYCGLCQMPYYVIGFTFVQAKFSVLGKVRPPGKVPLGKSPPPRKTPEISPL